jgi:hypothetical protein
MATSDTSTTVVVKTVGDTSGTDKVSSGLNKLSSDAAKTAGSTSSLTKAVALGDAAFTAAKQSVQQIGSFMSSANDSANRYQAALLGLATTSSAFGINSRSANDAAKELTQDGLLSLGTAAEGLQKLFTAGVGLNDAKQLIQGYKDQAAFGRSSTIGFEQAVLNLTESFYTENSAIGNLSGQTENWQMILEKGAAAMGKNVDSLSASERVEAKLIGQRMLNTVVTGNAAKMAETNAGAEARAAQATENLKRNVGQLQQAITGGLLGAYASFIGGNQQAVVSIGSGIIAAGFFGLALYGVVRAIKAFQMASIVAAATNPLVMVLTALSVLAGIVVYKAVDKMQGKISASNDAMAGMSSAMKNQIPAGAAASTKAMDDLKKKLVDIDQQIIKSNRDFSESMAEIVKNHQDKVTDLRSQLAEETANFKKDMQQRNDDFAASQKTMTEDHQKKVDEIQKQIDFESQLGKWSDKEKLADLQKQLADENAEYDQQAAEKQAKYDADVLDVQSSNAKKTSDLQAQLDTETAFLNQHAQDVKNTRNVLLLDEIDKLKRSHDENLSSLSQQKQEAIENAKQTAGGVGGVWDSANAGLNNQFAGMGNSMGDSMGKAFRDALVQSLKDIPKDFYNAVKPGGSIDKAFESMFGVNSAIGKAFQGALHLPGRAAGGPVQAGQPYLVGDNPDGTPNSTSEVFIPSQSGTIVNSRDTQKMLGRNSSGNQVTFNQTNYIQNVMDLRVANRETGYMLSII